MLASVVSASVIHVPGDSATIQKGLNGAISGDTVLVAAGNYKERLVWPSRDGIVLQSEVGAAGTEISGSDSGRVLAMNAITYTAATMVRGFTITHGRIAGSNSRGAGVWCVGSPVFRDNRIVRNVLYGMGYGGGVYAQGAPLFDNNLIAWDSIWNPGGGGWRYGGGVFCDGPGVFAQNVFLENAAYDTNPGGFWYGGGLYLQGAGIVFNNLFVRNRIGATTGGVAYGGALYLGTEGALVANNTFVANMCSTAIPTGAAIYSARPRVTIKNNILVDNVATGISPSGGGITCYPDSLDTLVCDNNDVWHNTPQDYYRCRPGPSAISLDPRFVSGPEGDYYLSHTATGQDSTSPCVDAGDTLTMTSPLNLDSLIHVWTTRTDSIADQGAIDIGYHYGFSAYPTAVAERFAQGASRFTLSVSPNPARGSARITYSLPRPGKVSFPVTTIFSRLGVRVHDVNGALVRDFGAIGSLAPLLSRSLTWDGTDDHGRLLPNGVYLVRVADGSTSASRQVLLLR
jgi:hypothetical protein